MLKLTKFMHGLYDPVSRVEMFVFNWKDIPEPGRTFLKDQLCQRGRFRNDTYVDYEPNNEEMDDSTEETYRLGKTSLDEHITQYLPEKYHPPYNEKVGLIQVLIRVWW